MPNHDLNQARQIGLKFEDESLSLAQEETGSGAQVLSEEDAFMLNFNPGVQIAMSYGPGVDLDDDSKNIESETQKIRKAQGPRVRRIGKTEK